MFVTCSPFQDKIFCGKKDLEMFGCEIKCLMDYLRENLLVNLFFVFNIITETIEIKLDKIRLFHIL